MFADTDLFLVTDDCDMAVQEITRFYANYDSVRYVDEQLVIRMRQAPTERQLDELNERFGHLCTRGGIVVGGPLPIEIREHDQLALARVSFAFARHGFGDLRQLIDTINGYVA